MLFHAAACIAVVLLSALYVHRAHNQRHLLVSMQITGISSCVCDEKKSYTRSPRSATSNTAAPHAARAQVAAAAAGMKRIYSILWGTVAA
jgi:hypothetical protein